MNSLAQKIYYKSPVIIQNAAVTAIGFKLYLERFNRAGRAMASYLDTTAALKSEEICSLQNKLFKNIARHAIENTDYYAEWAKKNSIRIDDIQTLDDISLFPIIEKSYLRENFQKFRAKNIPGQFTLGTSGTTGSPLTVFCDKNSRGRHYAFFTRLRRKHGLSARSRRATLFGRIILKPEQNEPPFWRRDYAQNNLLMSSYHLKKENIKYYYEKLLKYQPDEIFSYPSSISRIASHIVENGLPPLEVKLLMTTAENLSVQQRDIIQKAFIGKLVNQYGCTEMAFFCAEDDDGFMKFHPEHGMSEVRKEDGSTDFQGEGELIATGFVNYSMPVIRYAMGDDVILGKRDEKGYQILHQVKGRVDDIIYRKDGTPVGRLDPIFKGGLGVRYAQIYQHKDGKIDLKLVPDENYIAAYGAALEAELRLRVGSDADIEISILSEIEKSRNGKFRPVISEKKPIE